MLWSGYLSSFVSVTSLQFSSVAQSCLTLCAPMNHRTPGLPVHHQLTEFTQTHVHPVGDAIQPSHPLSSPSSPTPYPSQHQSMIQWVNSLQEVAKVLEFQLQHHSLQRNPRADFRMDWLDLLVVQGTLKSLLQHHSSKASILWCSAFFTVQLSHPYMTTGKTIALTRCCLEPLKTDISWWRVLAKHGPLEKGKANHFNILALRTSCTVSKGKKTWHWKRNSPAQ